MRIGIVGAGLAGLTCAADLAGRGQAALLFDKGRGPGGRMSTRRLATPAGEASFDHGAQYFTARDPAFRRQVDAWVGAGVAALWPAAGADAYVGVPTMNAPIRALADGRAVRWATRVTALERRGAGWRLHLDPGDAVDVDAVVVATPAEQAADLLAGVAPDLATRARATPSAPCWTVMLAFARPIPVGQDGWRGEAAIGWAARNSAKPGRGGPEAWVVQASPGWSAAHLDDDADAVSAALTAALRALLGVDLPPVIAQAAHRWRFARSGSAGEGALFDPDLRLGVCGDWLIGPRVEAAFLSGAALARRMAADPARSADTPP